MNKVFSQLAKPVAVVGLCCAAAVGLQGCVGLVIGGAVAGSIAASDRRTLGAQTEDKAIVAKGEVRINRALGSAAHVNVNAFNRRALLTGEVVDAEAKATAEKEVAAIDGVLGVTNEIEIAPLSSLTSRSNDTLITTKVKAALVETKDIYVSAFKIVTENGVVYLMGRVTQFEGNSAANAARGVNGVRKVVKVFEYINENELKEINSQPAPAAATN